MAVTLANWTPTATTLSATPGNCTQFDLPERTRRVRLSSTVAAKYTFAGTDGAAIGANVISVPTGAMPHTFDVAGQPSIYVATSGVSSVVEILAMD